MKIGRDIGIIFFGCFLFGYFQTAFIFGYEKFFDLRPAIFTMLYYSLIISVIYLPSYKVFRSKALFCLASWVTFFFLLYSNISGGENSNLTLYRFGYPMYLDGQIQIGGLLYKIFDPVGFMAIFSTILLLKADPKTNIAGDRNEYLSHGGSA